MGSSLSGRLPNFQSTPDLTLSDPRDREEGQHKGLRTLFNPQPNPFRRSIGRRGSRTQNDPEEEEYQGLVQHGNLRESLEGDEPSEHEDIEENDIGVEYPRRGEWRP